MVEKRLHRRVTVNVEVTCLIEGQEPFTAMARDISLGGMFLNSETKPDYGTPIVVQMLFSGETEVTDLPGTVRWRQKDGYGVQFGLLRARATHRLTQLSG